MVAGGTGRDINRRRSRRYDVPLRVPVGRWSLNINKLISKTSADPESRPFGTK